MKTIANLTNGFSRLLHSRMANLFGIFTFALVFMFPITESPGYRPQFLTPSFFPVETPCVASLIHTSWSENERVAAYELTRMELQSRFLNNDTCGADKIGLASTGADPAVDPLPAECTPQYNPAGDAGIASQTPLERRFILKELRVECLELTGLH
jgi:hypothetical protein